MIEAMWRYAGKLDLSQHIGARIQIPVHYGAWMAGARYGTVTQYRSGKPSSSDYVLVKLDKVAKRLKLWRPDWEYSQLVKG
jgi:hypothetical protein